MEIDVGGPYRVGGLVVAVVGFGLTRLFVTETLILDVHPLSIAVGLIPLVVGLGITVYGIALTIGPFSTQYVNTVGRWCVIGTAGIVVILVVTLSEPLLDGTMPTILPYGQILIANILLGGTVGGVLVGVHAARTDRHRVEVTRQANRGRVLTRLLRHDVVNAAAIVRGYATTHDPATAAAPIREAADHITETVDTVARIADDGASLHRVDLASIVTDELDQVRPLAEGSIHYSGPEAGVDIHADERVSLIVSELLCNAIEHGTASTISVALRVRNGVVELTVADDGAGLPADQRSLLESREFPEYDDPTTGFGLKIARILTSRYDGQIQVAAGSEDTGTAITISFPRSEYDRVDPRSIAVAFPNLAWALVAGLLAGVAMGLSFALITEQLPVIGALYGVDRAIVGWITHLFHSVVFALVFVAALAHLALVERLQSGPWLVIAAVAWGVVLWLVAAGLVMPLWLQMVGVEASLQTLTGIGLVSHAIWGIVLGGGLAVSRRFSLSVAGVGELEVSV